MLHSLRQTLLHKAMRQLLVVQKRKRQVFTLESARTVAVLFDATDDKTRREVLGFVENLQKKGKKVNTLGFFNLKQMTENQTFDFFTLKETTWTGQPKSDKAAAFTSVKTDLLICFNPADLSALSWMAAASQSAMKIGYVSQRPHDLDLQLEIPADKGIRFFIEQMALYLDKIR
jgi:hypothetical protein